MNKAHCRVCAKISSACVKACQLHQSWVLSWRWTGPDVRQWLSAVVLRTGSVRMQTYMHTLEPNRGLALHMPAVHRNKLYILHTHLLCDSDTFCFVLWYCCECQRGDDCYRRQLEKANAEEEQAAAEALQQAQAERQRDQDTHFQLHLQAQEIKVKTPSHCCVLYTQSFATCPAGNICHVTCC